MKFHFRKGMTIIGISLFSSCVFAGSYDHFYVGANVGATSLMDSESTTNPIKDAHTLSATGINGGVLLGYDLTLRNQWKLGLEGFANATDVNISDNQNYFPSSSYTVKMRHSLGVRLLPGYEFTPDTVGHVVVGYSSAQFKINDNGNYGIVNSQFNQSGFQLGLGMVTALIKNFSLRADVLYTAYPSQTTQGLTTTSPATTQNYNNHFSTLEGNLVLIYKLGNTYA